MGLTLLPVLATLLADPFQLNAGIISETRAGESPLVGAVGSPAFVATIATPQLEAELQDHRADFRLAYAPRFVWQTPNALDRTFRPLLLHQGTLLFNARPTATTRFAARAFGSYGEPDYSILPQLIGAGQGMLPQGGGTAAVPQIERILTFSMGALGEDNLSARLRLTLGLDVSHFRPLVDSAPPVMNAGTPAPMAFLRQTTVTASPSVIYRVTPHDEVGFVAGMSYATYSSGIELELASPALFWRAHRAAGDDIRLELGVSAVRDLNTVVRATPTGQSISPVGRLDALLHIVSEDEYGLWTRLRVSVDEFIDPVLAEVYPRALVSEQLTFVRAPDWSTGLLAEFTTSLRTTPVATNPDETVFTLAVPVRHRVTENLIVELGGRWSERAPALASSTFGFHERQLWAYVYLTANTRPALPWPSH